MKTGVELITQERKEQIEKHGRTTNKDIALNQIEQLSKAASILCYNFNSCLTEEEVIDDYLPEGWNKDIWKRMVMKSYKERLIIAGALIAAEIDRIQAHE